MHTQKLDAYSRLRHLVGRDSLPLKTKGMLMCAKKSKGKRNEKEDGFHSL